MDQYQLQQLIKNALLEDIGKGDHSTLCCIEYHKTGKAVLKVKQSCILAGASVAETIFKIVEPRLEFIALKNDGDTVATGEIAFTVAGHIHTILKCERVVLNTMQRMSGIASLTHQYARKLASTATKLLDTRKTTPNFRLLEKEAVKIGGGQNHRFGLYDMIMLKDNHIDYCGGIAQAIDRAYTYCQLYHPELKIEVEARTLEDVKEICVRGQNKVFRIMLDNFSPEAIQNCLEVINGAFEVEVSGGINLNNILDYAQKGVDYISVGGLIHQAQSVDLSLKAIID